MHNKIAKRAYLLATVISSLLLIPILSNATIQKSWQNATSNLSELDVNFILADPKDPNVIYAGVKNIVYKTTNYGASWRWILTVSGSQSKVNYIRLSTEKGNQLFVATENGLYRSTNQGNTWELIYKGKDEDTRNCLCVATSKDKIFLGTKAGFLKSLDSGRTWQKEAGRLGEIEITAISVAPPNYSDIFVATQEGVYTRQGEANDWERVYIVTQAELDSESEESEDETEETQAQEVNHITIDPKNSNYILLATSNGIISSEDKGVTWSKLTNHGLLTQNIKFLLVDPKNPIIYAATDRGVFEYNNDKWEELYKGIYSRNARCLSLDSQGNLWVATDQGVFKTLSSQKQTSSEKLSQKLNTDSAVDNEPTIAEIQKAVIKYADIIRPERLYEHRRLSAIKTLLPATDFHINVERDHWEGGGTGTKGDDFLWQGVDAADWYITAKWDFGDLIWDDQQRLIDNQQKSMVELRDDLLDKVTRYYFERKRLKEELLTSASGVEQELRDKELRLEELTAYIDALTGGYFSREIEKFNN